MNICKRALTIALRHPLYLIIYIGFLSSMGVVLMGEVGGSGAREATEVPRARIALVDRDGSAVAQSLEEMAWRISEQRSGTLFTPRMIGRVRLEA